MKKCKVKVRMVLARCKLTTLTIVRNTDRPHPAYFWSAVSKIKGRKA